MIFGWRQAIEILADLAARFSGSAHEAETAARTFA
jgi:hypothetical protein